MLLLQFFSFCFFGSSWSSGGWLPKFNQFFLIHRHVFGKIFMTIRSVVANRRTDTDKRTSGLLWGGNKCPGREKRKAWEKKTHLSRRVASPSSVLPKRSTVDRCVSKRRPLTLKTTRRSHNDDVRRPNTESRQSLAALPPSLPHATQAVISSDAELSADLVSARRHNEWQRDSGMFRPQ